jgi:hypothetical protein
MICLYGQVSVILAQTGGWSELVRLSVLIAMTQFGKISEELSQLRNCRRPAVAKGVPILRTCLRNDHRYVLQRSKAPSILSFASDVSFWLPPFDGGATVDTVARLFAIATRCQCNLHDMPHCVAERRTRPT